MGFIETTYLAEDDKTRTNFADVVNGLSDGTKDLNVAKVISTELSTNTISEKTSGSGVTIDGLLVKDGAANLTYNFAVLATSVTSGSDIDWTECCSYTPAITGTYLVIAQTICRTSGTGAASTYTLIKNNGVTVSEGSNSYTTTVSNEAHLMSASWIGSVTAGNAITWSVYYSATGAGTRVIFGEDYSLGGTHMAVVRIA